VHLRRDNPVVPSDLEQIPNLLNFIQNNGTISGNHHTPLISHTATDIITAQTGVYGDRMGILVANSYGFFKPDGSVGFNSGVEGPKHRNRGNGGAGQIGRDVLGDGRETQHIDVQHLAGALRRFEILAAVVPQFRSPKSKLFRTVDCFTTSAWRSSWLRMAVRMKSALFESNPSCTARQPRRRRRRALSRCAARPHGQREAVAALIFRDQIPAARLTLVKPGRFVCCRNSPLLPR
jgi:hypothetical protein